MFTILWFARIHFHEKLLIDFHPFLLQMWCQFVAIVSLISFPLSVFLFLLKHCLMSTWTVHDRVLFFYQIDLTTCWGGGHYNSNQKIINNRVKL
jgi:hypothetical protein